MKYPWKHGNVLVNVGFTYCVDYSQCAEDRDDVIGMEK